MKNIILASSLAVLAAGKATPPTIKSMPGATTNSKKIRSMIDAERRSIRESAKADAKAAKSSAVAAKSVAKEEGAVFTEPGYSEFFEIVQGIGDCSSTVVRVEGYEANRCMDWVIDNGDGTASTESELMIKPNNYGFPMWYFFDGHGCREENLYGHWRMRKTEFGFDRSYYGGCIPMYDGSGSGTPMFYQEARWEYMRFEPFLPSVMQGIDGKHKGCSRNKYAEYDVLMAGVCTPADNQTGTAPVYSYFDIANCASGSVDEVFFSDPGCNFMIRSETYARQECVFDYNEFDMELKGYGDARFEYRTRDCSLGSP